MSALPSRAAAGHVPGQKDGKRRRKTAGQQDKYELVELDLAILFYLMLYGPASSCVELANHLGSFTPVIQAHVRSLEKRGLVVVERGGRGLPNVIKPPKIGNPI